jgi:predicted transposase YdaD
MPVEDGGCMALLDDWMDNPFLQDWYREGREEGRAEGREEGRGVEAIRCMRRILEHRFGKLPEWALERLALLPADRLESMIAQVLEASTLEEAVRI